MEKNYQPDQRMHDEAVYGNKEFNLASGCDLQIQPIKKKIGVFESTNFIDNIKNDLLSFFVLLIEGLLGGLTISPLVGRMLGVNDLRVTIPVGIVIYASVFYIFAWLIGRFSAYLRKPYLQLRLKLAKLESNLPETLLKRDIEVAAKRDLKWGTLWYVIAMVLIVLVCVLRDTLVSKSEDVNWLFIAFLTIFNPVLFTLSCYLSIGNQFRSLFSQLKKQLKKLTAKKEAHLEVVQQQDTIVFDLVSKARAEADQPNFTAEVQESLNRYSNKKQSDFDYFITAAKSVTVLVKEGNLPAANISVVGILEDGEPIKSSTDNDGIARLDWFQDVDAIKRIIITGKPLLQMYFPAGTKVVYDLNELKAGVLSTLNQ